MEWQRYFSKRILDRGVEYYMSHDKIRITEKNEHFIKSIISGENLYDVTAYLENDKIVDFDCTCPYAEGGNYCKHMAALGFEIESFDSIDKIDPAYYENDDEELSDIDEEVIRAIEGCDIEFIKYFLAEMLSKNRLLFKEFKRISKPFQIDRTDTKYIEFTIESILSNFTHNRCLEEKDIHQFIRETIAFVDYVVSELIQENKYEEILTFIIEVIKYLHSLECESLNYYEMIDFRFSKFVEPIFSKVDEEDCKVIFDFYKYNYHYYNDDENIAIFLIHLLRNSFLEYEMVERKIKLIESLIDSNKIKFTPYLHETWFECYLSVLLFNKDYNKLGKVCKKNKDLLVTKKYFVDYCLFTQNYKKALKTLDEIIEIFVDIDRFELNEYLLQKKEVLSKISKEKELAFTKEMMVKYDVALTWVFKDYKQTYIELMGAENWEKEQSELLSQVKINEDNAFFYLDINELDYVEKCIQLMERSYEMELYINCLHQIKYKKTYKHFIKTIKQDMQIASNKIGYETILNRLLVIKRFKDGLKYIEELVSEWKLEYKNRKKLIQMLDELQKTVLNK